MTEKTRNILLNAAIYGGYLVIGATLTVLGYQGIGPKNFIDIGLLMIGAGVGHFTRGLAGGHNGLKSLLIAGGLAAAMGMGLSE